MYYSKHTLEHLAKVAWSCPDTIDAKRWNTICNKPWLKTSGLMAKYYRPEYLIKCSGDVWLEYAIYWLLNDHLVNDNINVYTNYWLKNYG